MLSLAIEKLKGYPETHHQVLLKEFLEGLRAWKAGLDEAISLETERPLPEAYPRIEMKM